MNFSFDFRRWSTPAWLYVIIAVNALVVGHFFVRVQVSESNHSQAVKTLSQDATAGIIAAQRVKTGLAEMDVLAAEAIMASTPAKREALMAEYAVKRQEVTESLLKAAEKVVYGPAEEVPLKKIGYVLPTYHKLVLDSVAQAEQGDRAGAIAAFRSATELMSAHMLPAADSLDKAYTYALNQRYGEQVNVAGSSHRWMVGAGVLCLVVLIGSQAFYARKFRRMLSPALAASTLALGGFFLYALVQFGAVSSNSREAREDAFDSAHVVWRARAEAVSVRRAEVMIALDPSQAAAGKKAFAAYAGKVLRLPDGQGFAQAISEVERGKVSDDLGGYLASVLRNINFSGEKTAAVEAAKAFSKYVNEVEKGHSLDATGKSFAGFLTSLDQVKQINQDQFEAKAERATAALGGLSLADLVVCVLAAILIYLGISPRLKEYSI